MYFLSNPLGELTPNVAAKVTYGTTYGEASSTDDAVLALFKSFVQNLNQAAVAVGMVPLSQLELTTGVISPNVAQTAKATADALLQSKLTTLSASETALLKLLLTADVGGTNIPALIKSIVQYIDDLSTAFGKAGSEVVARKVATTPPPKPKEASNTGAYLAWGAAVLAVGAGAFFLLRKKKSSSYSPAY